MDDVMKKKKGIPQGTTRGEGKIPGRMAENV